MIHSIKQIQQSTEKDLRYVRHCYISIIRHCSSLCFPMRTKDYVLKCLIGLISLEVSAKCIQAYLVSSVSLRPCVSIEALWKV